MTAELVFRYVSGRRGVFCCEWVPLPETPRVGDYVWSPSKRRTTVFDGRQWV